MVVGASVVVVVSAMFGKVSVQILTLCSFIGTLPLSSLLTHSSISISQLVFKEIFLTKRVLMSDR